MLDVVIISNYWHFPSEKSSSRYHSIASLAAESGFATEVVTSQFYHTVKKHRTETVYPVSYQVTLLGEPGYKKNVSLSRIYAHHRFAANVLRYLLKRKKPDVIYLFVPPVGLAKKVVAYANRNGIRVVADILDLWPEAFQMIVPGCVAKPLLYPMKRSAEYAYHHADSVIAVSKTYIERAAQGKESFRGHSVFIGTDMQAFDRAAGGAPPLNGKLRPVTMAYIGMLGHSYDLIGVMDAMILLRKQGFDQVELLIMGDGPFRDTFEHYAKQNRLPVRFTGRLPYEDMVKKLVQCDIGLNVLVGNAEQSIINKHADYVAAGLPVINVQKNREFGELLIQYHAGIMCEPNDTQSLAKAIYDLSANEALRQDMGKNSRRLAEDKFDRGKTYHKIMEVIQGEIK